MYHMHAGVAAGLSLQSNVANMSQLVLYGADAFF